jgi:hypothetical protein
MGPRMVLNDLLGDWTRVPADTVPVQFSPHCVERFPSRIREVPEDTVRGELSRLLASATVTRAAPHWLRDRSAAAYLRLGDDVCMPLWPNERGELVAATIMRPVSSMHSPTHRERISATKRKMREDAKRRGSKRGRWNRRCRPSSDPDGEESA